jgi:small GTP-binding protein
MIHSDLKFKVITAGDAGVGKTTLLRRYVDGKFSFDTLMTVGVDILHKMVSLEKGIVCSLQLWDLGGQQMFRTMLDNFISGASGGFLMYDMTNHTSFENLEEWINITRKSDKSLPLVLLAAKCDLEDSVAVSDEEALEFVERHNMNGFYRTSSKTGLNVDKAFETISTIIVDKKVLGEDRK